MTRRGNFTEALLGIEKEANRLRQMIDDSSAIIYPEPNNDRKGETEMHHATTPEGKFHIETLPDNFDIEFPSHAGPSMTGELRHMLEQFSSPGIKRLGPFQDVRHARRAQTLVSHVLKYLLKWPRLEGDRPSHTTAIRDAKGKQISMADGDLDKHIECYVYIRRHM